MIQNIVRDSMKTIGLGLAAGAVLFVAGWLPRGSPELWQAAWM